MQSVPFCRKFKNINLCTLYYKEKISIELIRVLEMLEMLKYVSQMILFKMLYTLSMYIYFTSFQIK